MCDRRFQIGMKDNPCMQGQCIRFGFGFVFLFLLVFFLFLVFFGERSNKWLYQILWPENFLLISLHLKFAITKEISVFFFSISSYTALCYQCFCDDQWHCAWSQPGVGHRKLCDQCTFNIFSSWWVLFFSNQIGIH